MPFVSPTKSPRYNPAGEAVNREQARNAELDRKGRNSLLPVIFVKGYGFRPYFNERENLCMKGPLCPTTSTKDKPCLANLVGGEDEAHLIARCDVCGASFTLPYSFEEFRRVAHLAYDGWINSQAQIVTLDVPYEAVKAAAEDEKRWVKVVWSQKDGRNQAIIYFIEKDANGDKAHIFADFEREEIRHDAGDAPPGKILAKIKAEFRDTEEEIKYKQN